jgi:bifunctional UDP-N-acetylglucosamine pyrophosphorylase/glucosamine-1-phosphate N-acetyltransferase
MASSSLPVASPATPGVAIILTAGESAMPLSGPAAKPRLARLLSSVVPAFGRAIIVLGPETAGLAAIAVPHRTVMQRERYGAAHAALLAAPMLSGFRGDAAVLHADSPPIGPATLARLRAARAEGAHLVVLTQRPRFAGCQARVIACPDTGIVERVVEWVDASAAERAIGLCSAGVVCARSVDLFRWLRLVRPHEAPCEHYLADIVAIAREEGRMVMAVQASEAEMQDPAEEFVAADAAPHFARPLQAA